MHDIPPFLWLLKIPEPRFPRPFFPNFPWFLSPNHPFTFSPKTPKPCKNAGKIVFFSLSLGPWLLSASVSKPQNHVKMQVFCLSRWENTVKMQVKCLSLGLGAPKSSQLGLLRAGCEALFLILCKTRKHCKNAGIGPFLCLLGLTSTPPPLPKRGFENKPFFSENHKTS